MIEFLNKGAHFSSLTGEKLSEFQVVAAVQAAQRRRRHPLCGRSCSCRPGASRRTTPSWSRRPTSPAPTPTGWRRRSRRSSCRQNVEYENRRETLRLGPIRIVRIRLGSWADFQRRRLAKSGGTVEQYKQPHLMPDLEQLAAFRVVEPVG